MTEASPARRAVTSRAQDGAWFLDRLVPGSPAHHAYRAYRVTGDVDLAALEAAWRHVAARHEILRTTLAEEGGRPVPRSAPTPPAAPAFTDLTASPDAERWCAHQAATPFDLATGPLARLAVARIAPREHLVALTLHRAVADDRSPTIVAEEISACYAALVAGRAPHEALPEPPRRYADLALAQRERESTPEFRRLRDWWAAALDPQPPAPALPTDRARPAGPAESGGQVRFDWDREVAADLHALAAAEQAAPLAVLLAALWCLLGRYGREERPAVAITADVRPPGFERVVGPCANLLVLPGDLSGRPSFRAVVARAARLLRDVHEHRDLPFDELVRVLNPHRDPYRLPWCDVMLVPRDLPEGELELTGTLVRPLPVSVGAARTDLALVVDRAAPTITGFLEYREGLFDLSSARRMLGQLRTLLGAALRDPGAPIEALPLEDADTLAAAVRAADRVTAAPVGDTGRADLSGAPGEQGTAIAPEPVHELVRRRTRERPDAVAVRWDGAEVTYRELAALAAPLTAALRTAGGVEGRPVAVRMPQGPRQVAALLGVLDAGAHLVCLGTGDTGERGRSVLADIVPACLVLDGEPEADQLAGWYRGELDGRIIDLSALDTTTTASGAAPIGTPGQDATESAEGREVPDAQRRAYVAYTSGSTGRPKGIPQSHAALAQFVTWFAAEFGIGPGSHVAQWAAAGYDASLVEIFATLAAGATLCPVPDRVRANPDRMAGWLAAERITHFQTVPSFARQLLAAIVDQSAQAGPDETPAAPEALGHLLLAGEPLAGELANGLRTTLPRVRLVNMYGPTETILATWHEITGPVYGVAPIGRSIPGRQVLVLDDQDRPCPAGVTGHLVIRSPHVTPGYIGAAAGERAPFRPLTGFDPACPGYRTGDLGRRRWDGALEFGGRADFQVKFNGVRTELTDIEAALAAHPSVAECAVVAVPDRDGLVTRLVGHVVPRPGQDGGPDAWRAALRRRFGKTMPPVSFRTAEALPRNVGGKVDRNALPRPAPPAARAGRPPRTPAEAEMAELWAESLGGARIEADTTFFTAGGHSLLIPALLERIRLRFGAVVSPAQFFADPTPAGLAALVQARSVPRKAVTQTMMG
ncbi:hypothetical protein Sme01_52810 [Sphaerisporangium melleum]|uniref:Carrier domain-containing protein n=1 Tax=Sphaerisporangium melleum TaxID=321316 RepID=A0A917VJF4_9ACTN|nr:AMP-binding protein [Sphaerisporangium melleum]GGK90896.1 hypothetical protein GCM10007964_36920 [Sphaerisporangium melleum]GII72805.1 hypothetical protein Sme01_52810 [Sphaerisporangium melleum]